MESQQPGLKGDKQINRPGDERENCNLLQLRNSELTKANPTSQHGHASAWQGGGDAQKPFFDVVLPQLISLSFVWGFLLCWGFFFWFDCLEGN